MLHVSSHECKREDAEQALADLSWAAQAAVGDGNAEQHWQQRIGFRRPRSCAAAVRDIESQQRAAPSPLAVLGAWQTAGPDRAGFKKSHGQIVESRSK
jgi:hypothetical protein